jgi:RNA polymerase sigma factor (sigma-70 family)
MSETAFSTEPGDQLLQDYLRANEETESERQLSVLMSQSADPVIQGIIHYKLQRLSIEYDSVRAAQDLEDIRSEVIVEVLSVLRDLKTDVGAGPIRDFRAYVAAITFRACSEYLRKKRPQRASLKDKARYVLNRSPEFALWQDASGDWLCGLAMWRDQTAGTSGATEPICTSPLLDDPQFGLADGNTLEPRDLIRAILNRAGRPLRFDSLIPLLADASGIKDDALGEGSELIERLPDLRASVATEVEQRIYLERVWEEIKQLPPNQRSALLLNLTDRNGNGVIALLPGIGIASLAEIAAAVDMTVERLAEIWEDLPLNDAAIAQTLGVRRQQVINLRKSARERLARRTRGLLKGTTA